MVLVEWVLLTFGLNFESLGELDIYSGVSAVKPPIS